MSASAPKVAILILNWNGLHHTCETLTSVRSLEYPNFDVWVVDNGSTDGSGEAVADQFPEVRVLPSAKNLGIGGARNVGLEVILLCPDVEYVLFLDNDVAVEPRLLDKLVAAAMAQADLGIVGPMIYYHSDPGRIWSAGQHLVFREVTSKLRLKNRLERRDRKEGIERVDSISGCCMLMKRQVFTSVGLFSPQYFLLADDTDFCHRAAKRGFASAVVIHARLRHKVSASTGGGYTPARAYYTGHSTMLFLKEHGRPWNWITTFTFATLSLPVAYLRELCRWNQRAVAMKLRGYRDGLLGRPVDGEVERYFQGNRSVPTEKGPV